MTREEAISWLTNEKWKNANNKYKKEWNEAFDLAIEALSADTVSREEYEELYRKAKEVNEMANDILADFPSYKELLSLAELKPNFESAVPNCQKCAIKELWEETEKEGLVLVVRCKDCRHLYNKDFCSFFGSPTDAMDYCSHGERREE